MIHQNKSVDIIPAVLPKSFGELQAGLERLRDISKAVQVDVVKDIFEGAEALPLWEEFDFEFDLFIEPAPFVERAVALGASRIIVHERFASAKEALQKLQGARSGDFAVAIGVGLQSHDTLETLQKFEGLYDYVQVMGIDHEGVQGEPPDPHHKDIELIHALRAAYPDLSIQVDGAVAPRVREFADAGTIRLVVGSAIVSADNPKEAYKELYTVANDLAKRDK